MGENRSGPRRPTGSEFGKRLAWLRDDARKRMADNRVLPVQRGPALGLSGLRCQGNLNRSRISATTIRRIATEAFPKCATSGLLRSTTNTRTLCNGHLSATMGITSHVFTTKRSTVTSRVTLAAIGDVIEEEESVSSDSSDDTLMQSEPEAATPRRRKVTFADEHGERLVRCRVFERDRSPVAFVVAQSLADSDTTDDDSQASEDEPDVKPADGGKGFSRLADDAYRHLNRDIDNLKKLIEKHRRYLDSLRPASPTEGAVIARSQDGRSRSGDLVDGLLPVTDANDNNIRCRFVNFYLADEDDDAMVKLKQIYFDHHEGIISGKVVARRLPERTELFVRYTTDDWRTQDDVISDVITASHEDTDEFDFRLRLNDASHVSTEDALSLVYIELAICYRTRDIRQEFWDNNGGQNYKLEVEL